MLCDIENFSPDNLRAISHVNFYAIPFPSLSQQYGNISWTQYSGTNCTVYFAQGVGAAIVVSASIQSLNAGSVSTNVIATLPDEISVTLNFAVPCSLLTTGWTPMGQNCAILISNGNKDIRARISENSDVGEGVIQAVIFVPATNAFAVN